MRVQKGVVVDKLKPADDAWRKTRPSAVATSVRL